MAASLARSVSAAALNGSRPMSRTPSFSARTSSPLVQSPLVSPRLTLTDAMGDADAGGGSSSSSLAHAAPPPPAAAVAVLSSAAAGAAALRAVDGPGWPGCAMPPLPRPPRQSHAQQPADQHQHQHQVQAAARFEDAFDLGELLGRGTFGDVRVATDRASGRSVAVKIMPCRAHGRDRRAEIRAEIAFGGRLQACPGAVKILGVYEEPERVLIVQELCTGGDVAALLAASGGHLQEAEVAAIGLAVLRFLEHTHAQGIAYGDVKPENFCLRSLYPSIAHLLDPSAPKGALDIAAVDFGCCQAVDTSSGDVPASGTPAYLAPEAFSHRFGRPSDVWSAGVLLYHLLSGGAFPFWTGGSAAFHDMTPSQLREGIVRGSPMFVGSVWAGHSPRAIDLIVKLLEKDPAARLTASEAASHPWFAEVLGEAAAGTPWGATASVAVSSHQAAR